MKVVMMMFMLMLIFGPQQSVIGQDRGALPASSADRNVTIQSLPT